jgi:two-component system heavy metal sensor histidine kinase CusS
VFRRLSLTARLTALFTMISATVLLAMGWVMAVATDRHFAELDRDFLMDKVHLTTDAIAEATSPTGLREQLFHDFHHLHGVFIRVVDRQGDVVYATAGDAFGEIPETGTRISHEVVTWRAGGEEYRGMQATAYLHENPYAPMRILIVLGTHFHHSFITNLRRAVWLYVAIATVLSGVLGWWAARSGLAPLRTMKARAQAVSARRLDERMPVETVPVEMADLARSLNDMLDRLQQDFRRLSDFSSDLAHELRTPISNLLTETQVALSQPRDAAAYREILASNAEEFQRLARTVSDMLFLAKAENGLALPHPERIALASEVQALFDFYEALAAEKGIRLELSGDAQIRGDRLMIRRAISNLLSNALRHTPPGGDVRVEITTTAESVTLTVENTGAEISPDALQRLFDRFFRADKSRSHPASEGAGLGLAITQSIMRAHGGEATATSQNGRTRFNLVFRRDFALSAAV